MHATPTDPLADSDGDFLPDVVEWAVLTSAASQDTDFDGTQDFIEVVHRGMPRHPNLAPAIDHEMRIVVSAPPPGSPDDRSWMHLMFRFAGTDTPVSALSIWFESGLLPGLVIPLEGFFAAGLTIQQRVSPEDGNWLIASAPLVSETILQWFLPCSVHAKATIEGKELKNEVHLLDAQGSIASLVAYGDGRFVLQPIALPVSTTNMSNKVCVMDLAEVGSGPGGTIVEVTHASCEDSNELECAANCPDTVGWILTIPGGLSSMAPN